MATRVSRRRYLQNVYHFKLWTEGLDEQLREEYIIEDMKLLKGRLMRVFDHIMCHSCRCQGPVRPVVAMGMSMR